MVLIEQKIACTICYLNKLSKHGNNKNQEDQGAKNQAGRLEIEPLAHLHNLSRSAGFSHLHIREGPGTGPSYRALAPG